MIQAPKWSSFAVTAANLASISSLKAAITDSCALHWGQRGCCWTHDSAMCFSRSAYSPTHAQGWFCQSSLLGHRILRQHSTRQRARPELVSLSGCISVSWRQSGHVSIVPKQSLQKMCAHSVVMTGSLTMSRHTEHSNCLRMAAPPGDAWASKRCSGRPMSTIYLRATTVRGVWGDQPPSSHEAARHCGWLQNRLEKEYVCQ
mmetsp:Transcript_29717/g.86119  ORF Transcript_29717/g.86119 Transcript_29717/m.86119 type:complete len:202 (+) Transcript_29717:1558-2163(+)